MAREGRDKCDSEYVRIEKIEEAFLSKLRNIRLNPDGFRQTHLQNTTVRKSSEIKSEISKVENAIHNLTESLAQAMDTPASTYIIQQITEYDKRKKLLEADYRGAILAETSAESAIQENHRIYDSICYLLDNFDQINYSGKNELIRKIVKKCVYDGEKLTISF